MLNLPNKASGASKTTVIWFLTGFKPFIEEQRTNHKLWDDPHA